MPDPASASRDLLTSRYECKYFVPHQRLAAVRDFIRAYVRPDRYAAAHAGYRYPICSLYLDSTDLRLYRMTTGGEKARFKLRLRRYAEGTDQPLFAEIKKRMDAIVLKRRAQLSGREADELLRAIARVAGDAPGIDSRTAAEFRTRALTVDARPMVRVKYQREAYESFGGEPARITFDTDLEYALTTDGSTSMVDGHWQAVALEGAIIEVKFNDLFPHWVRALIDAFELQKQSIPKYVLSMDHALRHGTYMAGGVVIGDGLAATALGARSQPWNR